MAAAAAASSRILVDNFAQAPRSPGKKRQIQCILRGGLAFVRVDWETESMHVVDAKDSVVGTIAIPHGFSIWSAQAISASDDVFHAAFFGGDGDSKAVAHVITCAVDAGLDGKLSVRQPASRVINLHGTPGRAMRFRAAAGDVVLFGDRLYSVTTGEMTAQLPESFSAGRWALNHDATQAVHVSSNGSSMKRYTLPGGAAAAATPLTSGFDVKGVAFLGDHVIIFGTPQADCDAEVMNALLFCSKLFVVSPDGLAVVEQEILVPRTKITPCADIAQGGIDEAHLASTYLGTSYRVRVEAAPSSLLTKRVRMATGEE